MLYKSWPRNIFTDTPGMMFAFGRWKDYRIELTWIRRWRSHSQHPRRTNDWPLTDHAVIGILPLNRKSIIVMKVDMSVLSAERPASPSVRRLFISFRSDVLAFSPPSRTEKNGEKRWRTSSIHCRMQTTTVETNCYLLFLTQQRMTNEKFASLQSLQGNKKIRKMVRVVLLKINSVSLLIYINESLYLYWHTDSMRTYWETI